MTHALILAAHGSHLDANAAEPTWRLAGALARRGGFDLVRTAFWKEEPSFARCLDGLDDQRVTVVPLFMAPGYFANVVLPRELGPGIAARPAGAPPVELTPAIGTHPKMAELAAETAEGAGATRETAVILLGHGTERHSGATANLAVVADRVRATGRFASVVEAFIDQEPGIAVTVRRVEGPVVVVPYFLAEGWHVGTTIPEEIAALALTGLRLAPPVGQHPGVADIVTSWATR